MSEFVVGQPVRLTALTQRVLAPNAGVMTGPGTNTYLIGEQELAVIDPGPSDEAHIDNILKAAGDAPIRWILATHTHSDHSPGVAPLAQRTGAITYGIPAPEGIAQDKGFDPQVVLQDSDKITTEEFTIQVVHTPGHASNHLCFILKQEQLLFTGDHIMEGSTVVIAPPDGNMGDYINSLHQLKEYDFTRIAPGHGSIIENPVEVIDATIQHRLKREEKVINALDVTGGGDLDTLVAPAYDDTPTALHQWAKFSLKAHLIKLQEEGRVTALDGEWRWLE